MLISRYNILTKLEDKDIVNFLSVDQCSRNMSSDYWILLYQHHHLPMDEVHCHMTQYRKIRLWQWIEEFRTLKIKMYLRHLAGNDIKIYDKLIKF